MSNIFQVKIPDVGEIRNVEIIEVLISVGDFIKQEQSLITIESEKASMEIPAPVTGWVESLHVKVGDKVSEGSLILDVNIQSEIDLPTRPISSNIVKKSLIDEPKNSIDNNLNIPYSSPSVRKLARELNINLNKVESTGMNNRITMKDLHSFLEKNADKKNNTNLNIGNKNLNLLPWPKTDFSKFGPIDIKFLSRVQKISGANLHRNWVMIPHVTNNDEADITDLEALRISLNKEYEKSNIKFTLLAFLIKATVASLKEFPEFNTSIDGEQLIFKKYYHIGFAVDTINGLVVPVIRDADKKGIIEISCQIRELAKKARSNKIAPSDLQGGCFSISSLGKNGGTSFTPIINAPEVAILGISRTIYKPVWNGKEFIPRLFLPISLSYDHRVIDGATAARFNTYLISILMDFRRLNL